MHDIGFQIAISGAFACLAPGLRWLRRLARLSGASATQAGL